MLTLALILNIPICTSILHLSSITVSSRTQWAICGTMWKSVFQCSKCTLLAAGCNNVHIFLCSANFCRCSPHFHKENVIFNDWCVMYGYCLGCQLLTDPGYVSLLYYFPEWMNIYDGCTCTHTQQLANQCNQFWGECSPSELFSSQKPLILSEQSTDKHYTL